MPSKISENILRIYWDQQVLCFIRFAASFVLAKFSVALYTSAAAVIVAANMIYDLQMILIYKFTCGHCEICEGNTNVVVLNILNKRV